MQTFVRVDSERFDKQGHSVVRETRYFLSSLRPERLSPKPWLHVVRAHWGVENDGHHTLDAVFREDERPWIPYAPQGTLALMLLRRIAYTLLALFRAVTERSEQRRKTPWRDLIRATYLALLRGDLPGADARSLDPTRIFRPACSNATARCSKGAPRRWHTVSDWVTRVHPA